MFLGLGQGRDRDQNFSTCWHSLQFAFKFYFLLEIILSLLAFFVSAIYIYFPNVVFLTVENFHVWRLFTSFLMPSASSFAIIDVLFDFYLLYMCMPDVQRKHSSAYVLMQVLLQVVLCNLGLTLIGYPLIYFGLVDKISIIGFGMLPIVFYFIWHKVAQNPQEPTRFCFFPCLIPMKYIPLCLLALFMLFGSSAIAMMIYCLAGYYQTMVRKQSILKLPLSVYRKIDSWMPDSVKESAGFIKVSSVQTNLRTVCLNRGICEWGNNEAEGNPFNNQRQPNYQPSTESKRKERVEVIGGGVSIGGSNNYRGPQQQTNFKDYWRQKNEQENNGDENAASKSRQVGENRQKLQSDQQFSPSQSPQQLSAVSSKALKKRTNDSSLL